MNAWRGPVLQTIRTEHEGLHDELDRAARAGGETAIAARSVMEVLSPHMVFEAEFAIPPLATLPSLARGELPPGAERILSKTDVLKAEIPRLLADHERIVLALQQLVRAATEERHTGYADFARRLIQHAQMEEEILYPAAILAGEHIRLLAARREAEDTGAWRLPGLEEP